jgi:hypothetical protein
MTRQLGLAQSSTLAMPSNQGGELMGWHDFSGNNSYLRRLIVRLEDHVTLIA